MRKEKKKRNRKHILASCQIPLILLKIIIIPLYNEQIVGKYIYWKIVLEEEYENSMCQTSQNTLFV